MTLFEAALLGIVQGVFMFVPVSSTAHLVMGLFSVLVTGIMGLTFKDLFGYLLK